MIFLCRSFQYSFAFFLANIKGKIENNFFILYLSTRHTKHKKNKIKILQTFYFISFSRFQFFVSTIFFFPSCFQLFLFSAFVVFPFLSRLCVSYIVICIRKICVFSVSCGYLPAKLTRSTANNQRKSNNSDGDDDQIAGATNKIRNKKYMK